MVLITPCSISCLTALITSSTSSWALCAMSLIVSALSSSGSRRGRVGTLLVRLSTVDVGVSSTGTSCCWIVSGTAGSRLSLSFALKDVSCDPAHRYVMPHPIKHLLSEGASCLRSEEQMLCLKVAEVGSKAADKRSVSRCLSPCLKH
eukprot:CAMPEP_0172004742 /NCGR_PEP_ID=MMETSP1041-20130122/4649_1 /TAXON_ID=464988 /ORGANISM="Hemiselmis andersenii, Strain CCMP439" /LENGTH=146 /DNA_ID=CAMNT_0012658637 /DNA_START=1 /DNA_END=441 /DNA_ORIENTATION=-